MNWYVSVMYYMVFKVEVLVYNEKVLVYMYGDNDEVLLYIVI